MSYGTLYLCATPIGNLQDITLRVLETLKTVDLVACEDTRKTLQLLNHFEISKPVTSYYEHNKQESGEKILSRILAGETCALVSDAGTPAISDPGEDLVKQCAAAGITVTAIPGPCAAITALSISAQCTGRFCFEGFLSTSKRSRREHLDALKKEQRTMIFYEAPHKLLSTLEDMRDTFGADRSISLCRELTKLHEEVVRTTLGEAVEKYTETPPKGEFVLIIAGAEPEVEEVPTETDAAAYLAKLLESGLSRKDAIKQTAKDLGLPKNVVYDLALNCKD